MCVSACVRACVCVTVQVATFRLLVMAGLLLEGFIEGGWGGGGQGGRGRKLVTWPVRQKLLLLRSSATSLGFTIWGEIFAYVAIFNPTIEVVTFRLRG